MSILTRMIQLWKADIHGVMDQFEDKKLLLSQHLRDMENALEKNEIRLKQAIESRDDTRAEHQRCSSEIEQMESDLDAALGKDRDDIAKFIIKKLKPIKRYHEELKQHLEQTEKEVESLRQALEEQRLEYERIRLKSKSYMNREERSGHFTARRPSDGYHDPSDEEIELELLRRKEALKGGN